MSEESGISNDDFTDGDGFDSLFGGGALPSLFDKTHGIGDVRWGIITEPPKPKHSRFFAADGRGALKYWGENNKPVKETRGSDGKPLRPVEDEVFVLQTKYTLSAAQMAKKDMDEDPGLRGVFAGGNDLRAIRSAIKKARVRNRQALVGMKLTMVRTGNVTVGDFEAWTWDAKLEKPTPEEIKEAGYEPTAVNPFADADA